MKNLEQSTFVVVLIVLGILFSAQSNAQIFNPMDINNNATIHFTEVNPQINPNNLSLYIFNRSIISGDPVTLSVLNVNKLIDTSNIYLEIYLSSDASQSYKYLGIFSEDISFIPRSEGLYFVKLIRDDGKNGIMLSQDFFVVSEISSSIPSPPILLSDSLPLTIPENTSNNNSANVDNTSAPSNTTLSNYTSEPYPGSTTNSTNNITAYTYVRYSKFKGATTDFSRFYSNLSSLKKVPDVIVEQANVGRIKWHKPLNTLNADIDGNIIITQGTIIVNSENLDSTFNSSATLTMNNILLDNPIILRNNLFCTQCNILSYSSGVLIFDVTGFSNYTVVQNTSMIIWDNNEKNDSLYDGNITKYAWQNIEFFANYTNQSDNLSIGNADCVITLSSNASQSFKMNYNTTLGLYFYNANFTTNNTYYYNVTCNATGYYTINLTDSIYVDIAGDLAVYNTDVNVSTDKPVENSPVILSATVHNLLNYNYTDVLVRFYDGDPDTDGIQIGNDILINITGEQDITINTTWSAGIGIHNLYFYIDPMINITETSRANNKAYVETFTTMWQVYYGNISTQVSLLTSSSNALITLPIHMTPNITIYVANYDSSISWSALKALTRNISGGMDENSSNDFIDIDESLGVENLSDSINDTYSINGLPIKTSNYTAFNNNISYVPEAMSTNTTNFYTGILWDASDTSKPYYSYVSNASQRADVVFVTKANYHHTGAYGNYDYEIRVPALLRQYKGSSESLSFYYEVK